MRSLKNYFYLVKNKYIKKNPKHVNLIHNENIKLNLGCGSDYKVGWINIDMDESVKSDICADFQALKFIFKESSVMHIYMMHSIGYMNLFQARAFFKDILGILKPGGILEMEFPDIAKCANVLSSTKDYTEFLEAIRAVYAFDLEQIKNQEQYQPYSFGWSGWTIDIELKDAGFSSVQITDPLTHDKRIWRDTRIVAVK